MMEAMGLAAMLVAIIMVVAEVRSFDPSQWRGPNKQIRPEANRAFYRWQDHVRQQLGIAVLVFVIGLWMFLVGVYL